RLQSGLREHRSKPGGRNINRTGGGYPAGLATGTARDAIAQLERCLMTVISSANRNSLVSGRRWSASSIIATIILVIGALYCFVPILWVLLASTKTSNEL